MAAAKPAEAMSPLLARIAGLVNDARRDAWKDVQELCDGALARSGGGGGGGGGGKNKKNKKNKPQSPGACGAAAAAATDGAILPSETLLCRAFQARANREMGKFEEALHACQTILKAAPRDAPTVDSRVLEQVRHVFQAYRMDAEILDMYAKAYSHTGGAVEELGRQLFFCYGRGCQYDLQQKLAMKMFRAFKTPLYAVWAATVMALQLQNADLPASKRTILLLTAERMVHRAAPNLPDRGQATEFYLDVLEQQGKFADAIAVLTLPDGPFVSAAKSGQNEGASSTKDDASAASASASRDDLLSLVQVVDLKSCTMLPAERLKLVARLSIADSDLDTAYRAYATLLKTLDADDWEAYMGIIDVAVSMGGGKVEALGTLFETLEAENALLRGPKLSKVALTNRVLAHPEIKRADEVARLRTAVQRYVDAFGGKPCCFGDLKTFLIPFVHTFGNSGEGSRQQQQQAQQKQRALLVTYLQSQATANSPRALVSQDKDDGSMPLKESLKCVRRCVTAHQLLRYIGEHHRTGAPPTADVVTELVAEYKAAQSVHARVSAEEARKLAEKGPGMVSQVQREFNCGDDFLLMAAHALLSGDPDDAQQDARSDGTGVLLLRNCEHGAASPMFWQRCLQALACLQVAHKASPDNFHLRLLIMRLCSEMGAFDAIVPHYDNLGPKHVQLETLSFLMLDAALDAVAVDAATQLCERIVHFHKDNTERVPEYMQVAFEHANVAQVQKFHVFREKLLHSITLARARAERGVLMFSRQRTPGEDMSVVHNFLKERILFQGVSTDVSPGDESFADLSMDVLHAMKSNDDKNVMLSWNPPVVSGASVATSGGGENREQKEVGKKGEEIGGGGGGGGDGGGGGSLEKLRANTVEASRAEQARLQVVVDTRIEMVVPKVMVWAFEGKADTMEEHCKSLEDAIDFSGGLDMPATRAGALEASGKAMVLMARAVQAGIACLSNPKSAGKLEAAVQSMTAVAQRIAGEVQPAICASVAMKDAGGAALVIHPQRMSAVSRFLRVDAYFFGTLCHACYRQLPANVLKLGGGKKKKKKGKKGKKGKGGASSAAEESPANKVRLALVEMGKALLLVLNRLKDELVACRVSMSGSDGGGGGNSKKTIRAALGCDPSAPGFAALSGLDGVEEATDKMLDTVTVAHKATVERTLKLLQDRLEFIAKIQ